MKLDSKIFIAGHHGMVGAAILRNLQRNGYTNLVVKTRQELDLTRQDEVEQFFSKEKPEYVFLGAAKVGGIMSNATYPADFIFQNLAIQTNIIHAAYLTKVTRLLFLGSVCIYPKHCPPADQRRASSHGSPGTNQCPLCHRQNFRIHDV